MAEEVKANNGGCGEKGRPITYQYSKYQPKGSLIIINGSLTGSRTQDKGSVVLQNGDGGPSLQFCQGVVDTLTISGHFEDTLTMAYTNVHQDLKANGYYDDPVFTQSNAVFTNESIVFTFQGETMKLSQAQRSQLLKVTK